VLDIFVDADGCPVKQEVYGVAMRYGLKVTVVANSWMRTPQEAGSSWLWWMGSSTRQTTGSSSTSRE